MNASELERRAQDELAGGDARAALRTAWRCVNRAVQEQDDQPVRALMPLAAALVERLDGKDLAEAETLQRYCLALLEGVGGGVRAPSLLDRLFGGGKGLFGRRDRMRCPECAEDIHVEAKVCRYCGHRLTPGEATGTGT